MPIFSSCLFASCLLSKILWNGNMICAKAAILKFFGLTLIPCDFSVSISLNNTSGSITTPEPIIEQQFFVLLQMELSVV